MIAHARDGRTCSRLRRSRGVAWAPSPGGNHARSRDPRRQRRRRNRRDGPHRRRRLTDGLITGVGDLAGELARHEHRRRRPAGHAGLRRHPHPLRRPGHLGRRARARARWHGVTTVVMGNCGVGFAPAKPDRHDWLIGLMEGVEDIPGTALAEGMTWGWESFPEYLDALDAPRLDRSTSARRSRTARCAPMSWASAARTTSRPPPTTSPRWRPWSRSRAGRRARLLHVAHDRPPRHRRRAGARHLRGRGRAVRHRLPRWASSAPASSSWRRWARPARTSSGRPRRSTGCGGCRRPSAARSRSRCSRSTPTPDLWRELMDESLRAADEGAQLWPQVAGRATGLLGGHFTTYSLFDIIPAYQQAKQANPKAADLVAALRDPERAPRRSSTGTPDEPGVAERMDKAYGSTFVLGDAAALRARPRALAGVDRGGVGPLAARGRLRRHARGRRAGSALRPDPQLRVGQPRPGREMLLHPAPRSAWPTAARTAA